MRQGSVHTPHSKNRLGISPVALASSLRSHNRVAESSEVAGRVRQHSLCGLSHVGEINPSLRAGAYPSGDIKLSRLFAARSPKHQRAPVRRDLRLQSKLIARITLQVPDPDGGERPDLPFHLYIPCQGVGSEVASVSLLIDKGKRESGWVLVRL